MDAETLNRLAAVASQLEEQLKFYREIGVTDMSGAAPAAGGNPAADFRPEALPESPVAEIPTATEQPQEEDVMAKKKAPVEQAGLFGELLAAADEGSQGKVLPVIEPQDASLEAIREDIGECVRCKLHEHRTKIVFGEGHPQAKLVFVGEGPGADEDATGRPFVGRAGQLLDKMIAAMGYKREDVYITNIVKCRPPQNRTPERDEVATCEQFLFRQLAFIRPQVIVALGAPAFQCLLKTKEPISKSRGQWRDWNGVKVMPTFHPAFLLRVPEKKREAWEDLKKVRDYLNATAE
jgi:DNA polymerase